MTDYKPGTVAMVSAVGTDPEVRLLQHPRSGGGEGKWMGAKGFVYDDHFVSDVRPLVVLDPDDRKQIERLMRVVRDNAFESGDSYPGMGRFADAMQAALRSQIKPPKPAEPTGLGAVVEDADGSLLVRIDSHQAPWACTGGSRWVWRDIDAVRVLSGGWEPKP